MKSIHVLCIGLPALVAACASTPRATPQLQAARNEYARASKGPAAQVAPQQLKTAHESLDRAEEANRKGDRDRRDFAELARSRAELANTEGWLVLVLRGQDAANEQLARAEADREAAQSALASRQAQGGGLASMQAVHPLARLADAAFGGAGGTEVVILSGLEFDKGSTQLTPEAKAKLDQVATALQAAPSTQSVAVEGFTDATGKPSKNQQVSQARAEAVARYLTAHGVPRDRLVVRGMGSANPVGDNATPEGRLGNRRVEIHVVLPPT